MKTVQPLYRNSLVLLAWVSVFSFTQGVQAQSMSAPAVVEAYVPQVGQAGKDVVWVPTPQALVDRMMLMAAVTPQDVVYDLGSGDGRTVITAAKIGARAVGIEYDANLVKVAQDAAVKEGVTGKATFKQADIFQTDFSEATVVTLFLLPDLNLRLRPTILKMKPGTRVVSNSFNMGDWEAEDTQTVEGSANTSCTTWCTARLWIVPANVAGTWKSRQGQIRLTQKYQMLSGSVAVGGKTVPITTGKMRGDQITFVAGGITYTGKMNGSRLEGTAGGKPWSATKG